MLRTIGLILCLFSFFLGGLNAQKPIESEKDLQKEAERLFKEGNYAEAKPLFSQLLSLYPDNVNYDFKFSVSMLYSESEPEKSISYLEYASSKNGCDKTIHFHLGKGYQFAYRFKDAIYSFNKFKANTSKKEAEELHVEKEIEQCKNGIIYLRSLPDLTVLRKTEISEDAFFKSYDNSIFPGKLIVKPDDFKTETDKLKKESSVIYLVPGTEKLFFSSYGTDEKNGKDIYRVQKIGEGKWGPSENIGDRINTSSDEDFPYLHSDGVTLYFSSKGHKSMGGYDIFKSTYNDATGSWSEPVNLGFPINSPFDDVLFITSPDNVYSSFASKRNASSGNYNVFKIKVNDQLLAGIPVTPSEVAAVNEATEPPLALETLKQKALLEVNAQEEVTAGTEKDSGEEEKAIEKQSEVTTALIEEEVRKLKPAEVIDRAYDNSKKLEEKSRQMEQESRLLVEIVSNQRTTASEKAKEAEKMRSVAGTIPDESQKTVELEKAKMVQEESDKMYSEASFLSELSDTLYQQSVRTKQEAQKATDYARKIETNVQAGSATHHIYDMLLEQENKLNISPSLPGQPETETATEGIYKKYDAETKKLQYEAEAAYENAQYYTSEATDVDKQVQDLNLEKEQTKDPVITEELDRQISDLRTEKQKLIIKSEQASQKAQKFEEDARQKQQQTQSLASAKEKVREKIPVEAVTAGTTGTIPPPSGGTGTTITTQPAETTTATEEPVSPAATSLPVASGTVPASGEIQQPPVTTSPEVTETTVQPPAKEPEYIEEYTSAILIETEAKAYRDSAANTAKKSEKKRLTIKAEERQKESEVHYAKARELQQQELDQQQQVAITTPPVTATGETTAQQPAAGIQEPETGIQPQTTVSQTPPAERTTINPSVYPPEYLDQPTQFEPTATYQFQAAESQTFYNDASTFEGDASKYVEEAALLRSQAGSATSKKEEKSLLKKAELSEKTSNTNYAKAQEQYGKAGSIEFTKNENKLAEMRKNAPPMVNDTLFARAINLESESRSDFNRAQDMREKSKNIKNPEEKKKILDEAKTTENEALNKQHLAAVLYTHSTTPPATTPVEITAQQPATEPEPVTTFVTEPGSVHTETSPSGEAIVPPSTTETQPVSVAGQQPDIIPPGETITTAPSIVETTPTGETQPEPATTTAPETTAYEPAEIIIPKSIDITSSAAVPVTQIPATVDEFTSDVFITRQETAYSSSNPIPVNPPVPPGVIFKVQVGAFRNPIPQNLFGGISPIMGETTKFGFTRYTAGLFKGIHSANSAKDQLRSIGFNDAFVTAYYNGRRISIQEALDILASKPAPALAAIEQITPPWEAGTSTGTSLFATDISSVNGLVYTVQVGAFTRPVNLKKKFNLDNLYVSHIGNFYRYNSGIFNDKESADKERIGIVSMGIKDAFVTAYNNGERVLVPQTPGREKPALKSASEDFGAGGGITEVPVANEEAMNIGFTPQAIKERLSDETPGMYEEPIGIEETVENVKDMKQGVPRKNVVYRVLLGLFGADEEVPIKIADGIVTLSKSEKVETRDMEGNKKAFYAGKYLDYESAAKTKDIAVNTGIPDARVVAFENESEISLNEALRGGTEENKRTEEVKPILKPVAEAPATDFAAEGDIAFERQDYLTAKKQYEKALAQNPEDVHALERLAETDKIISEKNSEAERILMEKKAMYNGFIASGDSALALKELESAKSFYENAITVFPDETEAKEKLSEAIRLIAEREAKFKEAMEAADAAFNVKDYEEAKRLYQEALETKPTEKYIEEKIAEADRLIAARIAEANRILQNIQGKYFTTDSLQNVAFIEMKIARDTLAGFDYEASAGTKDTTIGRGYGHTRNAVDYYEAAKRTYSSAQQLHNSAESLLLELGFKRDAVNHYLATIVPLNLRGGLLDTISNPSVEKMKKAILDAYEAAAFLQKIISKKIWKAWDTLHVITELDGTLRDLIEEAISSLKQPEFAFMKADNKLYAGRIRLILCGYRMDEINTIIYAAAKYNPGLFPHIAKEEVDGQLGDVRQKYSVHLKDKDASDQKFAESKALLQKAQATNFPVEKEEMIRQSRSLDEEGKELQVKAAEKYLITRNAYEIARYKFLVGDKEEEDPDIQRLEYIIQ